MKVSINGTVLTKLTDNKHTKTWHAELTLKQIWFYTVKRVSPSSNAVDRSFRSGTVSMAMNKCMGLMGIQGHSHGK
jgi:hypothetical protein